MWTAIAAAGSNLLGSVLNYKSQQSANETNIKLAREARDWEERMSNTAVQRHAKDLEAAGFNRLLAATGQGASTPSAPVATAKAPQVTPLDIMAIEKARQDISKTKADTAVSIATAGNLNEQNANLRAQNVVLQRQAEKILVDMGYTRVQAAKILSEGSGSKTFKTEGSGGVPGFVKGSHNNTIVVPNVTTENAMSRVPF